MNVDFRVLRALAAALLIGVAATASGCSEETVAPPPDAYAPISVFHGIVDADAPIQLQIRDRILANGVAYGTVKTVDSALVGTNTEVKVLTTDGTELSKQGVAIAQNRSVWVIAAGRALAGSKPDIFAVSSEEPTPPAGRALVRIINASHDLGKVDVHESDAFGAMAASNLDYKGASAFTSFSPNVTQLSVTAAGTNDEKLAIHIAPALQAGKLYNIVIYGTTNPSATEPKRLKANVVIEP